MIYSATEYVKSTIKHLKYSPYTEWNYPIANANALDVWYTWIDVIAWKCYQFATPSYSSNLPGYAFCAF